MNQIKNFFKGLRNRDESLQTIKPKDNHELLGLTVDMSSKFKVKELSLQEISEEEVKNNYRIALDNNEFSVLNAYRYRNIPAETYLLKNTQGKYYTFTNHHSRIYDILTEGGYKYVEAKPEPKIITYQLTEEDLEDPLGSYFSLSEMESKNDAIVEVDGTPEQLWQYHFGSDKAKPSFLDNFDSKINKNLKIYDPTISDLDFTLGGKFYIDRSTKDHTTLSFRKNLRSGFAPGQVMKISHKSQNYIFVHDTNGNIYRIKESYQGITLESLKASQFNELDVSDRI